MESHPAGTYYACCKYHESPFTYLANEYLGASQFIDCINEQMNDPPYYHVTPRSLVKPRKSASSKEYSPGSNQVPGCSPFGLCLLTSFLLLSFRKHTQAIPFTILLYENEQQAMHFSRNVIFDIFFLYLIPKREENLTHEMCYI